MSNVSGSRAIRDTTPFRSARSMAEGSPLALSITHLLVMTVTALSLLLGRPVLLGASAQPDPMAQVKQGIGEVIALFQDRQMPLQQRREKLRSMAPDYFDFEDMAKSALGYHWRELSPAQRQEFVPVFTAFIQDAYLSKLEDYSVQKIQNEAKAAKIDYDHERLDGAEYAEVFTKVGLPEQKDPIEVDYEMHRRDGIWRIYDIKIDAISVIANYRNQFNRVINNDGYDQLLAELRAKQEQLRNYMEHPPTPSESH